MNRHIGPIWMGSMAVLTMVLVLPAHGQHRMQKSSFGQGGMHAMCGKGSGGQSSGMPHMCNKGGGMQNPFMQAGRMQNPFMQGGGMQNPFMQGVGMQNPFMQGGGMQNPFMQGGGMQNPFMQGGGVQNPIQQAGFVQDPIMPKAAMQRPLAQTAERKRRVLPIDESREQSDHALLLTFTQSLQDHASLDLQTPVQDPDRLVPRMRSKQQNKGAVQAGIDQAFRSINGE